MTHKVIFTVPFYLTCGAHMLHLLGCLHHRAIKRVVAPAQPTSSHTIPHHSSASFPRVEKREKNRETNLERQEVVVELIGGCPSSLFCLMAEPSWPALEVTREHLQKLVSKGYMIAAEFATCPVPVDPASPALTKGLFMSEDLVCCRIGSSTPCSSPMVWSCIN
jgi:hypothetical protein